MHEAQSRDAARSQLHTAVTQTKVKDIPNVKAIASYILRPQ